MRDPKPLRELAQCNVNAICCVMDVLDARMSHRPASGCLWHMYFAYDVYDAIQGMRHQVEDVVHAWTYVKHATVFMDAGDVSES